VSNHHKPAAMRILLLSLLALFIGAPSYAQDSPADSTGLPGDGFSLSGALDLFKTAKDLEAFEQALNTEDQKVNNLDLDGNGEVDYIRVVDHRDGDVHAIVMQVAMSKEEAQDVAVIELEKNGEASAMVQIRGAEELYGPDVLMEPFEEVDAGSMPTKGPAAPDPLRVRVWVNVWAWPCVSWIYGPAFVAWISPWYWGHYPHYWRPWHPIGWHTWHGWHRPYHAWYRPAPHCTVVRAHAVYRPRASYSPRIRQATEPVRQHRAAVRTAPTDERKGASATRSRTRTVDPGKGPRTKGHTPPAGSRTKAPRVNTTPVQRSPKGAPSRAPSRAPKGR